MIVVKYEVDTDEELKIFVPNSRMGLGDEGPVGFAKNGKSEPNVGVRTWMSS